jgi:hypothetical protein
MKVVILGIDLKLRADIAPSRAAKPRLLAIIPV